MIIVDSGRKATHHQATVLYAVNRLILTFNVTRYLLSIKKLKIIVVIEYYS